MDQAIRGLIRAERIRRQRERRAQADRLYSHGQNKYQDGLSFGFTKGAKLRAPHVFAEEVRSEAIRQLGEALARAMAEEGAMPSIGLAREICDGFAAYRIRYDAEDMKFRIEDVIGADGQRKVINFSVPQVTVAVEIPEKVDDLKRRQA